MARQNNPRPPARTINRIANYLKPKNKLNNTLDSIQLLLLENTQNHIADLEQQIKELKVVEQIYLNML